MRIDKNNWLITKPIAHRGLWNDNIVENSMLAYQNAVDNGYPIEIDVYLTRDNHLVSFHDDTLKRMTGAEGFVYDKTLAELKELRLLDTDLTIPTLDEILEICENKVALLIEIKNQPDKKVVDALVERLKSYKGEFAIQSFNLFYISRVKKLAPQFIRGILTYPEYNGKGLAGWAVRKMPFLFLAKPDFISIQYNSLPVKKRKRKDRKVIAWTVTSQEIADKALEHAQNIIFENFIPKK